jgi:hypothetical protein
MLSIKGKSSNMSKLMPSSKEEETIKNWLLMNLHEVINDLDVIPSISFNLPVDVGRANASKVTSIRSVDLKDVQLISLSYSKIQANISVSPTVNLDVSWEDYLASSEVRELVGESEEFMSTSFDAPVELKIAMEFELIKEPPMVANYRVLSIDGETGGCTFS